MALTSAENRKSVSFTDGAVVFDEDGTQSTQVHQEKATAESHSARAADENADDATAEDTPSFDADLKKKKKKKSKSDDKDEADEGADDFDAAGLKELKKKKKKSKTAEEGAAAADEDDIDAAVLKELKKKKKEKKEKKKEKKEKKTAEEAGEDGAAGGAGTADGEHEPTTSGSRRDAQQGDMELGTGIWAHESVTPISYDLLLDRFFNLLAATNPGFAAGAEKNYRIPPPECRREGNKKTIFANIYDISARVKRTMEHVMSFLFTELGTSGSVDGAQRLVIKGRYQQKQLENVLIKYINEYVLCKTCRSVDTELEKGENRLHFVQCNKCGSRRSAAAIKSGFSAQIGRRKRQG